MARKTKEESQKTRDFILDAAEFVFCEKGVTHAAMADIAERAGVSRGAVYGHYKNKIEVALEMCRRALDKPTLFEKKAEYDSPLVFLRALYLDFLRGYVESGSLQRVLEIMYCKCEESEENRPILDLRERWENQCQQDCMSVMEQAISKGELPVNLGVGFACMYLDSLVNGLCGSILSTVAKQADFWENTERILDTGLDALKFSAHMQEKKTGAV